MKPLVDIYKDVFFRRRNSLLWRVPIVCNVIIKEFNPSSVVDVGCAIGGFVMGFHGKSIFSYGIEGSERCLPHIVVSRRLIKIRDLREKFDLGMFFDLAMCFEVAEHIESEYADQFLDNLTRLSDRVLLTAAPPGQGGHYHVNCQPKQYWIDKFNNLGYKNIQERAENMKISWEPWKNKGEMSAYYKNLLYFEKEK